MVLISIASTSWVYVVGTHLNCLNKAMQMSNDNICFYKKKRKKKISPASLNTIFADHFSTLNMLWANSADNNYMIFFLIFPKRFWQFMQKMSPMLTICMKYQNQFSGKNKKNVCKMSSAKIFTQSAKH